MKRTFSTALVLVAAATAAGCYIDLDDDDVFDNDGLGDITIEYTFDGLLCDQVGVQRIRLSLEGQRRGDTFFDTLDCAGFRDGVIVYDLLDDDYTLVLEGLGSGSTLLYSMEQPRTVTVYDDGGSYVTVALRSITGDLTVNWAFPGNAPCGEVTFVDVRLREPTGVVYDDSQYDCTFGGVEYNQIPPGLWTVQMTAVDSADREVYRLSERVIEVVEGAFNEYTLVLND